MTEKRVRNMRLGRNGPEVSAVGLGLMGMAGGYGPADDTESIATIHAALDAGVTFLDAGDFYGHGHTELLLRDALKGGRRDRAFIAIKFGAQRSADGKFMGDDNRPNSVKNFLAYSLKRLGTDHIDLYQPARLDPSVPIEDTIGAIADLVKAGYVRHIGLSEVGVETIRRAAKVHPIVDLQIEYSLVTRKPEDKIFPVLAELGLSATLYGVMSRGLLTGAKPTAGDARGHMPRFTRENQAHNERVVAGIAAFAADHARTPAELMIAWTLAKQPALVPVIGARKPAQLDALFAAVARPLTAAEVAALEALVPRDAIAGDRYPTAHMAQLDSER
jgi:aryl-alcohol dehydrogenase-like predicted oxidoreductase